MKMLRVGSRVPEVRLVQRALNRCMLPPNNRFSSPPLRRLAEDSDFGPKTQAMVREFQRLNGIAVDGIVGPDTSYLLFPFISFNGLLNGQGRILGRREPLASRNLNLLASPGGGLPSNGLPFSNVTRGLGAKEPEVSAEPAKDAEKEGFTFEASVGPGLKHEFKPWFVLKPADDPEGAKSSATLAVEATILRTRGFEFGGGLEFSRQIAKKGGSTWEWEGSVKGAYTNIPRLGSVLISPVADISIKQGLKFGAGLGVEASIELRKDLLELSVGGKIAGEWDPHEGNVQAGFELGAGLKLKWDITQLAK